MYKYDVSIVIPIYNNQKYIRDCVKSILNQDYKDFKKIQVILVDDGSEDNSLEICKKLQEEIKEFKIEVLTGNNEGVSKARNKGIKASEGKYIMFIDSDDFISKNAISKLVEFFDKNYDEIDIVTYAMYEYDVKTKNKKIIQRYKECFVETRIYDLEKEYYAIQPTMNVIVKNLGKENILFEEGVYFHEDILYNTQIAMKKTKIGYVKDAKYLYRIYGNSTTDYKENPLYSFEQYMHVFETLFNQFKDSNGNVKKYVQRIALNVIRYRINHDTLFPYYLEGQEKEEAYNRILNIINQIDDETIMQYNQMHKYHKMYLIDLKHENIRINRGYNKEYTINNDTNILSVENNIEIVMSRFKFKNKKVEFLGFLKSPLLKYGNVKLYIYYIDKDLKQYERELELSDTVSSRIGTDIKVANFKKFDSEIKIKDITKFGFKILFNEHDVKVKYYFNKWVSFNTSIGSCKIYDGKYRIQFKENEFYVSMPKKETRKKDFYRSIKRYSNINKNINIYRVLSQITKNKKKKIWIYIDRKNIFDNAYSQFKHDIKIKDNIDKYYILDGKIENYREKFTKEELKYIVKFGSIKHKLLFLNSDKILTSFSSLQEYCPFNKNYNYYKDILKYDLIYLQHGILHAKLLRMYAKTFTQIDKFVISSQFEKDNLINNYEYLEKDLIEVGMPRLDDKQEGSKIENKIIFAPSWREYLIGKSINRKRKINKEKFMNSKYYKETIKFLENEQLINELKEKNLVLDYKLHPIIEQYKDCFNKTLNDNITVSIGDTDLNKYKAFITDFSSFQFDFVKLQRPIIYFMPDIEEFKSGLHTYKELDLKHEDAFGKLCIDGKELVSELIKLINNNFKMDQIYKERMENFFFKVENRKDKLYKILKEEN